MIISIITKDTISEKEINDMTKYYTNTGMVVIPISRFHIVVKDETVYDVNKCTSFNSYSVTSIAEYLNSQVNELVA